MLLVGSGYTLAAYLTGGPTVNVPFLGLSVERQLVEALAVSVLGTLALAFYGTVEALISAHQKLAAVFKTDIDGMPLYEIDEHPNVLDFLSYVTLLGAKRGGLITRIAGLVLYPLPLLAAVGWTAFLWWTGYRAWPYGWPWMLGVHLFNAAILCLALTSTVRYLLKRLKTYHMTQEPVPIETANKKVTGGVPPVSPGRRTRAPKPQRGGK